MDYIRKVQFLDILGILGKTVLIFDKGLNSKQYDDIKAYFAGEKCIKGFRKDKGTKKEVKS